MIRFADNDTMQLVRDMWKVCFNDSDAFIELYFSRKYRNRNTLVYFEEGQAVASLQILPYDVRFYGKVIPCGYISGACTLPDFRGRGYMKHLLMESFRVMQDRQIALSLLIPAEDWLYGFYAKCGYQRTFEEGTRPIDLKSVLYKYPYNLQEAYALFNSLYQEEDFCILKTESDFSVIADEYIQDGCPAKYNLAGMSRVMDAWTLLDLYVKKNPRQSFRIKVTDDILNKESVYLIQNAGVELVYGTDDFDIEVDIKMLTRLLWGFKTDELPEELSSRFEQHSPVMNLMLE